MLMMQWQSFFSLTAISVLILNVTKQFAVTAPLSLQESASSSFLSKTFLADNSHAVNKQNQTIDLFKQLNLTSEQRQKINLIHHQYHLRIRKKRNTLAVLQQQLSDMMVGVETSKRLRRKNRQLAKVRQEIDALLFESMLATRETLTLQQRQKFRDLVQLKLEQ